MQKYSTHKLLPFLAIAITQLHLLRNFSQFYFLFYFLILASSFFYLLLNSPSNKILMPMSFMAFILLFPLVTLLWGIHISPYEENGGYIQGITRIIFSLPLLLILFSSPTTENQINYELKVTSYFMMLAALSIPFQWFTGPIEWFADSSFRNGLPRYASLMGSLTVFGQFVGGALIISLYSCRNLFNKILILLLYIACSFLSLQKAAIINIIISLLFLPYIFKVNLNKKFILQILIAIVFSLILFLLINQLLSGSLLDNISSVRLFSSDNAAEKSDDFSIEESIFQRMVDLPMEAIRFHGIGSMLFGVGPIGGAGAFGYAEVPMAHNGIVDILVIGGLLYFLVFLIFNFVIFRKIARNSHDTVLSRVAIFLLMTILINLPFAGLIYYVPVGTLFFIMAVKIVFSKNDKVI